MAFKNILNKYWQPNKKKKQIIVQNGSNENKLIWHKFRCTLLSFYCDIVEAVSDEAGFDTELLEGGSLGFGSDLWKYRTATGTNIKHSLRRPLMVTSLVCCLTPSQHGCKTLLLEMLKKMHGTHRCNRAEWYTDSYRKQVFIFLLI